MGGDDEDDISLPDTNEVALPRSPNYNPDLSDDDMSRSPSPFNPENADFCLPEATRHPTHRTNVPSAAPESYFQKNIPRLNELYVNKPIGNGETVKTKLPIAYWKWPTGTEEHKAEQDRKARNRENYVPTVFNPVARTLNDSEIRITVQPTARPPHINWIMRKIEAEEEAKTKATEAIALAARLKKEKKQHREKMEQNKDAANAAVLAGVQLDEDGFYRVKGTRKRRGPGIDMEESRPRRTYTWKAGPPLRGKALKEARAKAQLEADALVKARQERMDQGEEVTCSEDEDSSEEEAPVVTKVVEKVVKKVAKAGKTAVAARKSAAPRKPRAPRKPAAPKRTAASKKNTVAAAKRLLDDMDDSEIDVAPVSTTKKGSASKRVAVPNKTPACKRTPVDSKDANSDAPPISTTKKASAKRVAAPKKTPISAERVLPNFDDSESDAPPVSTAKKTPAAKKPAAPKKTPAAKKTPASKKFTPEVVESDDEDFDPPTPPAKKAPVKRKSTVKKTPASAAPKAKDTASDDTPVVEKIIAPKKKAANPRASFGGVMGFKDLA